MTTDSERQARLSVSKPGCLFQTWLRCGPRVAWHSCQPSVAAACTSWCTRPARPTNKHVFLVCCVLTLTVLQAEATAAHPVDLAATHPDSNHGHDARTSYSNRAWTCHSKIVPLLPATAPSNTPTGLRFTLCQTYAAWWANRLQPGKKKPKSTVLHNLTAWLTHLGCPKAKTSSATPKSSPA